MILQEQLSLSKDLASETWDGKILMVNMRHAREEIIAKEIR
jgi:hypothetical protein